MGRVAAAALCLAFCTGMALASGYDDYMAGVEAMRVSNFDLAIQSFTKALADGDLAPVYVPVARFDRAAIYLGKGQCAAALADLDEALKFQADYLDAYRLRAAALQCLDRKDDAIADLTAALALSQDWGLYRERGQLRWYDGAYAAAADDFAKAAELNRRTAYPILWYAISAARTGGFDKDKFADMVRELRSDDWPYPLLKFIRGDDTAADVYSAVAGEAASADRKCEADFYIAEWHLTEGAAGSAKDLLLQAQNECRKNLVEFGAAKTELRRIP